MGATRAELDNYFSRYPNINSISFKKKIKKILSLLGTYYPNPKVPLNFSNNFTLLVAVVLSAQCTDARVNLVTETLFPLATTPEGLLKLGATKLEEIIRPCGLYRAKTKSLIATSEILVSKFHSVVPDNFKDLESLPGVGHKTASVLMSHVFNKPAFPVDTHIHRLAKRWGLTEGKSVVETERDLKSVFDESLWYKLHLQFIYYGREYCRATRHEIGKCPICKWCSDFDLKKGA